MAKGSFRKDLYYRLRGARLDLPPLRERKDDIPLLINKFWEEFWGNTREKAIDEEASDALSKYDYPGNIRELRSILQSAVNLAQGRAISINFLPDDLRGSIPITKHGANTGSSFFLALAEVEKSHIIKVYEKTGRNKAQTAEILEIGLSTLRRKLAAYGLD